MKKIILAITGASGSIYGIKALEYLLANNYSVDLILSKTAPTVIQCETEAQIPPRLLDRESNVTVYDFEDLTAACASGSNKSAGMIIAPCSMGTVGRIANGVSDDLISRTADVMLKEKRKLALLFRDTPLNHIHLKNLLSISEAGGIIIPASPAFYHKPETIDDQIDFILGKVFDVMGIENNLFTRWS